MKPNWNLLPYDALLALVKVMTFGLAKHQGVTWPQKSNDHHFEALMRHLIEWKLGKEVDEESGLSPLAHAGCRMLFLIAKELRGNSKNQSAATRDSYSRGQLEVVRIRHGEQRPPPEVPEGGKADDQHLLLDADGVQLRLW